MRVNVIASLGFAAAVFAVPAEAHHTYAMFDHDIYLNVSGTVHDFLWTNPHSWLTITVTEPDGTTHPFGFETRNPGVLARLGMTHDSLKPGDKVKITYHPMKDGSHSGDITNMILADGKEINIDSGPAVKRDPYPHY